MTGIIWDGSSFQAVANAAPSIQAAAENKQRNTIVGVIVLAAVLFFIFGRRG